MHDATASSETRSLTLYHTHSRESLTVTFKRQGRYDEAGLKQLNHFLRDWRSQDKITMDRHLFDIIWEVYRDVDASEPIKIVSAYRAPATNAMLHRRSSGVARHSQHTQGRAMDFFIPGVPVERIRNAALRLQRGGVGFYPTSGSPFVHLDTGSIRHWPRMSADQLARVFPNGRTVHVPTNGKPLPGYQLALADVERRGRGEATASRPSLFTSLFSRGKSGDDEDAPKLTATPKPTPAAAPAKQAPVVVAAVAEPAPTPVADIPMPRSKPADISATRVASTITAPVPLPAPVRTTRVAALAEPKFTSPADIINARGFWDDTPSAPKQATPAQVAAITARQAVSSAQPRLQERAALASAAMAYAPENEADRTVVTASAPIPRSRGNQTRNTTQVSEITTVVAKGSQGGSGRITLASRMTASPHQHNNVWLRAMILSPSAARSMSATTFGEADLTHMRVHFVKPATAVAMKFSSDPTSGMICEKFTGSATSKVPTTPFMQTASLR